MKKKGLFSILSIMCFGFGALTITSCGENNSSETVSNSGENNSSETVSNSGENNSSESLATCPTEEYVIKCLEKIPNITEIEAATEMNDPNGQLNKQGGYTAHVYFALDVINLDEDIYGYSLLQQGTEAGGSVEVYSTKTDAKKRDEYLATFDGSILASGSHAVYGTCVIRTSNLLTATWQKLTTENIIYALTGQNEEIKELCPNHKWDNGKVVKNATCTTAGNTVYTCEFCGKTRKEEIAAYGHTEVIDPTVEPTCTETGLTEGKHCSICGKVLIEQEVIAALGHTEVVDKAVAATCKKTGLTEGSHCSTCNEVLVEQIKVEMLEHTFVNKVCSVCSSTDYYTKGLKFTMIHHSDNDFSYSVSFGQAVGNEIVIPSYYKGIPVTSIGTWAFKGCSSLKKITIGNNVTSIGSQAFYGCYSLTSITIPNSVTSISDHAFWECSSLKSIIIPNSVTSIEYSTFADCSSLTSVTIPNSVTSIGGNAFSRCSSLTSITIPDSVTSIGDCAFYNCSSLTSVTIPDSVTSIGEQAFHVCWDLTDVYYTGTQEQWEAIYIDDYNYCLTSATIHYNYNPAVE